MEIERKDSKKLFKNYWSTLARALSTNRAGIVTAVEKMFEATDQQQVDISGNTGTKPK